MDVSEQHAVMEHLEQPKETAQPGGHELLDTVAQLTGLPDSLVPMVHDELKEILDTAGQDAGNVTLDQLRQAMLLYLEALALEQEKSEQNNVVGPDLSYIPSV